MITATQKIYTVEQAATALGCTGARIRQICIAYRGIGRKHGKVWMLDDDDLKKIRNLPIFGKRRRNLD